MSQPGGWIGVDLDGTLAYYDHWRGVEHIGEPIPAMVERVKAWIAKGIEVRIMTARVFQELISGELIAGINERTVMDWCEKHIGQRLTVTCCKDYSMVELWDDRAVQVTMNTGEMVPGQKVAATL